MADEYGGTPVAGGDEYGGTPVHAPPASAPASTLGDRAANFGSGFLQGINPFHGVLSLLQSAAQDPAGTLKATAENVLLHPYMAAARAYQALKDGKPEEAAAHLQSAVDPAGFATEEANTKMATAGQREEGFGQALGGLLQAGAIGKFGPDAPPFLKAGNKELAAGAAKMAGAYALSHSGLPEGGAFGGEYMLGRAAVKDLAASLKLRIAAVKAARSPAQPPVYGDWQNSGPIQNSSSRLEPPAQPAALPPGPPMATARDAYFSQMRRDANGELGIAPYTGGVGVLDVQPVDIPEGKQPIILPRHGGLDTSRIPIGPPQAAREPPMASGAPMSPAGAAAAPGAPQGASGAIPMGGQPVLQGGKPVWPSSDAWEAGGRAKKAVELARFLHDSGIPSQDLKFMGPDHWNVAAQGATESNAQAFATENKVTPAAARQALRPVYAPNSPETVAMVRFFLQQMEAPKK